MPLLIAAENAVVAVAFFAVFVLIAIGLYRDRSLGTNPLGIATAAVFLTCSAGHAVHAEHYLLFPEIYGQQRDSWHEAIIDGLTVLAGLAYLAQRRRYGMVIRGSHPLLDYQRRLQMSEALRDVGLGISAETDTNRLLGRVVNHARDLLGGDYAAIAAIDSTGKLNHQQVGTRTGDWTDKDWKNALFLSEHSAPASLPKTMKPVVISDVNKLPRESQYAQPIHQVEGARSILAAPVFSGTTVVGALLVAYRSVRSITQDDLSGAAALASQAAVAMEKAQLIESLRAVDRLKDEFIASAAHELKTPVTAIKGWAEIMLTKEPGKDDQRMAIETIHKQAGRITRLSEDLLAAVRLHPGLPSLKRERFDLSALTMETIGLVRSTHSAREFHVSASHPVMVNADKLLIGEMLGRLLENAVRYSPAAQPIEVEVRQVGREAVVSVTDHGISIPSDRQPHVFEAFYEPIPPGHEGYVGTVSLGLYLSKHIAEAHGGRIWFASAPERGSTFSFALCAA